MDSSDANFIFVMLFSLFRFIFCDRGDVYEESIDFYDTDAQEDQKRKERQRTNELLAQIDFTK